MIARKNQMHSPLLTDFYQVTMAFSYFQQQRHLAPSVFDVFYRKNPFKGHYSIFCGLEDVKEFIKTFGLTEDEICYVAGQLGLENDHPFADFLRNLEEVVKDVKIYSLSEGSICFPKVPVIRIEGPLAVVQLMETPILAMTGFSSLVATNASRICAASEGRPVMEFGLRRAQGADGGMSASKYAVLGGCSFTSNVFAGFREGISISGTMAHSYICGFQHTDRSYKATSIHGEVQVLDLARKIKDLCEKKSQWKKMVAPAKGSTWTQERWDQLRESELNAFASYAIDFPTNFLALVDTYDTVRSGGINFLYVSAALILIGYSPRGIRLDSGDLALLAKQSRELFSYFFENLFPEVAATFEPSCIRSIAKEYLVDGARKMSIVASNDLHEEAVKDLLKHDKNLEIDVFGIGTHLATCKAQPALGMVYKLVQIEDHPCIKFSQEEVKQTYPSRKSALRLYKGTIPVADVLCLESESISRSSLLYNNQDFKQLTVDFDYVVNLYEDEFQTFVSDTETKLPVEALIKRLLASGKRLNPVQDKLKAAFVVQLSKLSKRRAAGEPCSNMELTKCKVEARKSLYPTEMLCALSKENPEFEHPVLLSEGLLGAIRKGRGESIMIQARL